MKLTPRRSAALQIKSSARISIDLAPPHQKQITTSKPRLFIKTPQLRTAIPSFQHFPQAVRNSRMRIYHTQNHNITATELAPTERRFCWQRQSRENQRPSKFLVLPPVSWFSIGQKNSSHTQQPAKTLMFLPAARYHAIYYHHDPTSSQQRSWDRCKLPNLPWSSTIVTKSAASKDPDATVSSQFSNEPR